MTITSTSNKITYTGSGTTGPFTYNFKIFEDTDLEVTKYTISDGTSVTLALTTDYTVTGAGDAAGGTITLVASLSSSYRLIIRRVLPITQEIDYIANDPFPAATHEEALDRSTMINQQQQEQIDRAVLVPVGTTTDPEDLLEQIEASAATATAAADTAEAAVGSAIYLWGATVGGTADAITLTPSPAITLYSAGMRFAFLATGNNTGAATVNISGLGAKSVKTLLGAALAPGDITSGNVYSMTYDGTDFRIHESPKVLPAANGGAIYLWGGTVGGTADVITLTPTPAILAYATGMRFAFAATGTNTGATTVNISGLGAKNIKSITGAALSAGEIVSGRLYSMSYNGTEFRLHENTAFSGDASWTDYSATSTISGFSGFTRKLLNYKKVGKTVFVFVDFLGTSNATTITFTVPYTNIALDTWFSGSALTGGTNAMASGSVTTNSDVVTLYPNAAQGSWSNGTSAWKGQFFFESSS